MFAAFSVAIPVATYIIILSVLAAPRDARPTAPLLTFLAAVLMLAAAAATPVLTLPVDAMIMVVIMALLLAYYLAKGRHLIPRPPGPPVQP
jgi:hypothetical protein